MNSRFQIFTLRLCSQTKYNYQQHQVRLSAGRSWSQSTKINLSFSAYLAPEGMWAVLILQLSTKSQMQKCWWEQWLGKPHTMLQPHMDAPVTLLPRNTASTAVMETAIKHTQLAKSNLSTAICTASNHSNHIFVETWKVRLEGTSGGPSALPCPRASCSTPTHPWSLLLPKTFLSQNFRFLIFHPKQDMT